MTAPASARVLAARAVAAVLGERRSLTDILPGLIDRGAPRDRALVRELAAGTLRLEPRLSVWLDALLNQPLPRRGAELRALLLVGLYQLVETRIPPHAAVNETVAAATGIGAGRATGLVNAVLRNFTRRRGELEGLDVAGVRWAHPEWLVRRLHEAWPGDWEAMLEAGNRRPPMTLRVNRRQGSRDDLLDALRAAGIGAAPHALAPEGVQLERPCDVADLPGFAGGSCSVQDAGAQFAAPLLEAAPGMRVLDACCAPGGKTAHLLEAQDGLDMLALDVDAARLERARETLARLGLSADLRAADAAAPASWWDGRPFDRILLDAPCSASGVIRRHPDIKQLRRDDDIAALARRQRALLAALWPLLAPGGILLYCTCSILPDETAGPVRDFLAAAGDARERPIAAPWGRPAGAGRQILPGERDMDGFYYARLEKVC